MTQLLFDEPYYIDINQARWAVAERVLRHLQTTEQEPIQTCLDVGCGPGWFSERIARLGIEVTGLEGRKELADIAAERCPAASFRHVDIEDGDKLRAIAPADLVFCFGILYHVENPFMLLRNLHALTRHQLFIESIFIPSDHPCAWLVAEGRNETQGLTHYSFILSRPSLMAILQRVGFPFVYQYNGPVAHQDFNQAEGKHPRRGIFLASKTELGLTNFEPVFSIPLAKFDFTKRVTIE